MILGVKRINLGVVILKNLKLFSLFFFQVLDFSDRTSLKISYGWGNLSRQSLLISLTYPLNATDSVHQILAFLMQSFFKKVSYFTEITSNNYMFNPLTPKIWLLILSALLYFHVNKLQEFGVRSREQLQPDTFEYSHYLFGG